MKKVKIVSTVFIVILVLGLVTFWGCRMFWGSKLNIKIIDSYAQEIVKYADNKMPFTIENKDENQIITVNGELYKGQRFYNPGEYKIEIRKGIAYKKLIVNIKEIERKPENEYYIYLTSETLQTLFVNLEIADKKELNGFLWTKKATTIDSENMIATAKNLIISENIGNIDDKTVEEKLIPEVKEYIKNVLQNDENAYFHLYLDEYRFFLEFDLFGLIGLDDSRYDVTLYSDGTLSYIKCYETATAVYSRDYRIREENAYDIFLEEKANYEKFIEKIRCGEIQTKGQIEQHLINYGENNYNFDYLLLALLRENVRYLLQYPEMITFEDEKVAEEMKEANFEKIVAVEEFRKLDEESQNIFFKNIKLDKETLDVEYFKDANAEYLVITGTKPFYGKIGQENFERLIKQVYEIYNENYIILYKPHPSALPDENQEQFLNSLEIKVLPGTIPMEAISFIYPNLKLGGFDSSLYMSADAGKTEFFFVPNKEALVPPLNQLYDDLFSDAEFYY